MGPNQTAIITATLSDPLMHNGPVNKFDPGSVAAILALDDHPEPGDGQLQRFSVWAEPHVLVGDRSGRAVAYTHSYGLIRMSDKDGGTVLEWHRATNIKRVDSTA